MSNMDNSTSMPSNTSMPADQPDIGAPDIATIDEPIYNGFIESHSMH